MYGVNEPCTAERGLFTDHKNGNFDSILICRKHTEQRRWILWIALSPIAVVIRAIKVAIKDKRQFREILQLNVSDRPSNKYHNMRHIWPVPMCLPVHVQIWKKFKMSGVDAMVLRQQYVRPMQMLQPTIFTSIPSQISSWYAFSFHICLCSMEIIDIHFS